MFIKDIPYRRWLPVAAVLASSWILLDRALRTNDSQQFQMEAVNDRDALDEAGTEKIRTSSNTVKLILVTLFRGGSSFLGDLLNHDPTVLYWFEPLHPLFFAAKKEYDLYSGYGSYDVDKNDTKCLELPESYVKQVSSVLKGLLDCNIASVDERIFIQNTFFVFNKLYPLLGSRPENTHLLADEVDTLRENCLGYEQVVVKSIRLSLYMITSLFERDPSIKIIYYIRDPRAVINSRLRYKKTGNVPYRLDTDISRLCCRLMADQDQYALLRRQYPERILLLRYEDLALQPRAVARKIYGHFLGLPVPSSVGVWINESTTRHSSGVFSTQKVSALVVNKWRTQLDRSVRETVERRCYDVLKLNNYL